MKEFMTVCQLPLLREKHCATWIARCKLDLDRVLTIFPDVFQTGPAMFRRLRERLHYQILDFERGGLCHAMRG
jgi:hypothetical protein